MDRSVAAVTIVVAVVVVVVVDVDVLLLPFSVSMIGDCECRSFVGDALLFPSLIGELTFTEWISGATVAVAVVAAAEAVAAVTVEVVPTTAAAAAAVDDVAMLVVGDVDVDGAVVESVLFVESRPTTLSLLPFLNIPFSSVIFAHFVGGNAFNLRNR